MTAQSCDQTKKPPTDQLPKYSAYPDFFNHSSHSFLVSQSFLSRPRLLPDLAWEPLLTPALEGWRPLLVQSVSTLTPTSTPGLEQGTATLRLIFWALGAGLGLTEWRSTHLWVEPTVLLCSFGNIYHHT